MQDDFVIVGVLARITVEDAAQVCRRLTALPGVETFDVGVPEKLGIVIEAPDIDAAHRCLREQVDATPGVLGTWPVSLDLESAAPADAFRTAATDT